MPVEDLIVSPRAMSILSSSQIIEALAPAGLTIVCRHCGTTPQGRNGAEDPEWTLTCACRTRRGPNLLKLRQSA